MLPKIVSSLSKVLRTWEDCAILHSITSIMLLLWCIRYWGRGEHQRNDEIRTLSWSVIWNVLDRRKTQKSSHLPKSYISSEDNDPMHKTSLQKKSCLKIKNIVLFLASLTVVLPQTPNERVERFEVKRCTKKER